MAKKFEKTGNYLLVSDTVSLAVEVEHPSKDTFFTNGDGNIRFYDVNRRTLGKRDGYNLNGVAATGSVDLTGGASGSVDGITVNSVQIMSGAENFDTDLDTTATNVADNINAFTSTPNYTASANGTVVTITAVDVSTSVNGFAVVSSATTITTSDTNMAGATTQIVDSGNTEFADLAALLTFLRANTGA